MARLFGEKLRVLRQQHGIVQTDLARTLGVVQSHIASLETGKAVASLEFMVRAADVFGVTADSLLRDTISVTCITQPEHTVQTSTPLSPGYFGANLHRLRTTHNLTQHTLAQRIGITKQAYISNLEAGRKLPSPDLIVRIADVFGVTVDQLLLPSLEQVQES
ncbi:MAG: hypothetical protein OHK0022_07190 [Roseiflexaceae bacterium]